MRSDEVTQEGHYKYFMPYWKSDFNVTVKKIMGSKNFQVWFDDLPYDYYEDMQDIPTVAEFTFVGGLRFEEK